MPATWYLMEDGSVGDPAEIAPGKDGKLRHKDGRAVAYGPHGPRSRSIEPDQERAKAKPAKAAKEMKPEDPKGGGYKTRALKSDG